MVDKLPAIQNETPAIAEDFEVPTLVTEAGSNARYAWEEFLYGEIENAHTRRAYGKAVSDLLDAADQAGLTLQLISPKFVRQHFERMKSTTSIPTRKLRLSGIKRFFDIAVTRHAMPLNPALSVRGEKYSVTEGKTPEISPAEVAKLLKRCDESAPLGLRDKTIIALMAFTAARVNAVANLRVYDFAYKGNQWVAILSEKGGKNREIPVRHDLELLIKRQIQSLGTSSGSDPLFPTAIRKSGKFSSTAIHPNNVRDMLKKRLLQAGLTTNYTPHSFRVCTLTDLLKQDVPREDVQYLAGHADARTTALYDRRSKKVTRNIVERISIKLS
jgi:site-specific recombinase XerD